MLEILDILRPALGAPSFANMMVIFAGWVLTPGRHAVTEALVQTRVSGHRHHEAFHRFFSRARWTADRLGLAVFLAIRPWAGATLRIAIDDTLAPKKGPHVHGIGCHLDAARSTRRFKVFSFGHCWVVLAVLVAVPFSDRRWALPVLFRLYRNKSTSSKGEYRKKTQLAREMLATLLAWAPDERVELAADSAYCCREVLRDEPERLIVFGSMPTNAALYDPPPAAQRRRKGRPAKRGKRKPTLEKMASNPRLPWQTCTANLYGELQQIHYKSLLCLWPTVCGERLLHVVLVRCDTGARRLRVYFSSDFRVSVVQLLEGYSLRWAIEVCFRDLKQHFGFADSSARSEKAVRRTAPFVGLAYCLLIHWFASSAEARKNAVLPLRPWYPHKRGFSFLDVLAAAQSDLRPVDFRAKVPPTRPTRKSRRPRPGTKPPPANRAIARAA